MNKFRIGKHVPLAFFILITYNVVIKYKRKITVSVYFPMSEAFLMKYSLTSS